MRLSRLYVRFFRSFNFDYERKAHRESEAHEWETIDGAWFPFVRVQLDPAVTAIVGANESGKSHLIAAIRQALTGQGIDRRDFCRYSPLYSVETGRLRLPDLGIQLVADTDERESLREIGMDVPASGEFTLLRLHDGTHVVDSRGDEIEVDIAQLEELLPRPFELETDVALPDSISLDDLIGRPPGPLSPRRSRFDLADLLRGVDLGEASAITERAEQIADVLGSPSAPEPSANSTITPEALARSLLVDVARIDPSSFEELEEALREGEEGRVGGLIEQMNRSLARYLNFARWWRQDRDFQLRVAPREREIVFTIRDRTGTDYSFRERSTGLRYFLSYFIQLQAHRRATDRPDAPEVLLMDEPDAYLSSSGQQDLLRALESFARPDDGTRRDQVVYVTHSPFLINKNQADRIRVLDKGSNEEGSRLVRDAARNHYEPLRTSIGSQVAETAFIGGANLLVEGVADQVLITGTSALLRHRDLPPRSLIDLNDVTIVAAGSAQSVPYMAYLARGRDQLKPPCVVLLDGDEPGREAKEQLRKGVFKRAPILDQRFVLDLGEWAQEADLKLSDGVVVTEIEDLVPLPVAAAAARSYATRLVGVEEADAERLDADLLAKALPNTGNSIWDSLATTFGDTFDGAHIDKIGFAREVVDLLDRERTTNPRPTGFPALEQNFAELVAKLSALLHEASNTEAERRRNRRLGRLVRGFLRDFTTGATRDEAAQALRDIESGLEDTFGDDAVRIEIGRMRRDFKLRTDPLDQVPAFEDFRRRLEALPFEARRAEQEPATGSSAESSSQSD